jgi:hypothetical protein
MEMSHLGNRIINQVQYSVIVVPPGWRLDLHYFLPGQVLRNAS